MSMHLFIVRWIPYYPSNCVSELTIPAFSKDDAKYEAKRMYGYRMKEFIGVERVMNT